MFALQSLCVVLFPVSSCSCLVEKCHVFSQLVLDSVV
jgi:hypothetical protein